MTIEQQTCYSDHYQAVYAAQLAAGRNDSQADAAAYVAAEALRSTFTN